MSPFIAYVCACLGRKRQLENQLLAFKAQFPFSHIFFTHFNDQMWIYCLWAFAHEYSIRAAAAVAAYANVRDSYLK